jgi:hypothetical protein
MPRARKPKPLPDYLEELISLLEVQAKPDHLGAIREVEGRHDIRIELAVALDEYEEFEERYRKWQQRLELGLLDSAANKALDGRGSPTNALKEMRAIRGGRGGGGSRDDNGRLVLEKHHASRVAAHRRGW